MPDAPDPKQLLHQYLKNPAVITIDVHRGHLDPSVATLPAPPEVAKRVTANIVDFLDHVRARGVAVVHMITKYRSGEEITNNPFWHFKNAQKDSTRANIDRHNLLASPGLELMPGVFAEGDHIVDCKKRYDCFYETDLDFTLRVLGAKSILLVGVNTNSCVLATSIAANVRDYAVFVVNEGVDSMDGEEAHATGLKAIELAFGWAVSAEEVLAALR